MSTRSTARVQDLIAAHVSGRRVLDIGCVEHDADRARQDTWLHAHLVRHAASVVGVDIVATEVERLRQQGYTVICADAVHLHLDERFEIITAGEILEHLDEPGRFLRTMREHLTDDGALILTTPHAYFAYHVLEAWVATPATRWNPEHVAWYEPFTLGNLLARNGFAISHLIYTTRSRKLRGLLRALHLPCWPALASTLLVIAGKAAQP